MKRVVAGFIVVLAVVAYVAGYWPEYQRRVALEGEVASLRAERDDLDARVRAGRLLGSLLNVTEAVSAMNFGQAQTLSSAFFDDVRAEEARAEGGSMGAMLAAIQQSRDVVTSALARGDAAVITTLRSMQIQLREALGYPVPPPGSLPAPVAPPLPAPIVPDQPAPTPDAAPIPLATTSATPSRGTP